VLPHDSGDWSSSSLLVIDVLDVHRLETTEKNTNRLSIGILFTINLKADTTAPQNHILDEENWLLKQASSNNKTL